MGTASRNRENGPSVGAPFQRSNGSFRRSAEFEDLMSRFLAALIRIFSLYRNDFADALHL